VGQATQKMADVKNNPRNFLLIPQELWRLSGIPLFVGSKVALLKNKL